MQNGFPLDNFEIEDADTAAVEIAAEHLRHGRSAAAKSILQEILKRIPNHSGALNCLAAEALMRGDTKKSEEILGVALRSNPKDVVAIVNLGQLHLQNQRLSEARLCLERAEALAEWTPALNVLRINLLAADGQIEAATRLQREALSNDPKNAENYYNLGVLLTKGMHYQEAEESFQQAIFLRPAYREAWHNLGNLQARSGRLKEAIFSFKRALLLLPGDPASISALVDALIQIGRASEAEEEAKRGLVVVPGAVLSTLALGRAQLALGRKQEALAQFASTVRAAPDHPLPLVSLARGFSALGNHTKAADAALMACRRPGGQSFCYFAVELLLKAGRFKAAWDLLKENTTIDIADAAQVSVLLPEKILEFLSLAPALMAAPEIMGKAVTFLPTPDTIEAERLLAQNGFSPQDDPSAAQACTIAALVAKLSPDPNAATLKPLQPDPNKLTAWRKALASHAKPVIALAFNGENDGEPALPDILAQLDFPCTKLGLLTGSARKFLTLAPDMLDAGPHLHDLGDIAAAMAAADFVIAGRGIGGHIAGAFGLKGAVLVPLGADWCWGAGNGRHWFTTLQGCHATDAGWAPALAELSKALAEFRPTKSVENTSDSPGVLAMLTTDEAASVSETNELVTADINATKDIDPLDLVLQQQPEASRI